jgi:hypothetical protein
MIRKESCDDEEIYFCMELGVKWPGYYYIPFVHLLPGISRESV